MAKKDEIISKWSDKIRKSVIDTFVEGDNTPTTKYLTYMCSIWYQTRGKNIRPKSSFEVVQYIRLFDALLPYIDNKDIYSSDYNSWNIFKSTVDHAQEVKSEKEFKRDDHVTVIFENNDYILVRPKTHRGSLKYGANTKWCTASKHHSGTFTNYVRNGVLVYLNRKNLKNSKWDKIAFYVRANGEGPIMNVIETYCSQDIRHSSNTLLKCDWDLIQIVGFQNLVRSVAISEWRSSQAKKTVKEFIHKVHELDILRAIEELNIVKEGPGPEYQELVTKFRETVEKFSNKVKLVE